MPTTNPFAYNTGSTISGTEQFGNVAVGVPTSGFEATGLKWWNGPDQELGYVIAHESPTGQPGADGETAYLGFWRTDNINTTEFVNLSNFVANKNGTPQNFTDGNDAKIWLNANGYWTSYDFVTSTPTPTPSITPTQTLTPTNTVTSTPTPTPTITPTITPTNTVTPTPSATPQPANLLVYLDTGNSASYPGTGNTWFDLVGTSNDATLFNSPTYSSSNGGILQFDDASSEYATIPNIGNLNQWTVEVWFKLSTSLTGKVTSIISNQFDLINKLNFSIGTNNAPTNRNIAVGFYDGAWRTTTGFVPQVSQWYQVVGTYDGSTIRQYINGVASGGTVNYVGTPQSGGEVRLMRRWDDSLTASNLVDGDLSIVKIYSSALSAPEVLQNFDINKSRYGY